MASNAEETPVEETQQEEVQQADILEEEELEEELEQKQLDPELELDDPDEAAIAQRKALTTVTRIHPQAGTFKTYMDNFVNPVLFSGLQELCKRRPDMPIEFLAYYLIENNPRLKKKMQEQQRQMTEEAPEEQPEE